MYKVKTLTDQSQLQNPNFGTNPPFFRWARSLHKLPILIGICQFLQSASQRKNHRICAEKRVLQLAHQPTLFRDIALILLSSFVLGLFAKVSIPLPFTPVPIATQSCIVLLLAALLGAKRAGAAVFSFLAQGAFGLPVFAGGAGGITILLGPRGGYLIGYLACAFIVGWLIERKRIFWSTANALIIGTFVIYFFGAGYLATMIGLKKAFLLGVAPFLLGDALKILACMKLLQWLRSTKKSTVNFLN